VFLPVVRVINPAVGCHDFLSGQWLSSKFQSVTAIGRYQFILLGSDATIAVFSSRFDFFYKEFDFFAPIFGVEDIKSSVFGMIGFVEI